MKSRFLNLLKPPVFDDLEKTAQARSINTILLGTLALTVLFLIYALFNPPPGQMLIAFIAIALEIGLLVLIQLKQIRLASGILTSLLWIAIVIEIALYGGIRDTGFGAFAAIIIIAGLTLGARGSIIYASLTLVAAIGLALAETLGRLPPYINQPITSVLFSHAISLLAVALLLNLAIRSITSVAQRALQNQKAEEEVNKLLETSQSELQQYTVSLEQRTATLQTAIEVSQLTSQLKNEKELLEKSAQLLVERIHLDHIGLFLLDQTEEYAILRASGGQEATPLSKAKQHLRVAHSEVANIMLNTDTRHLVLGEKNYYYELPDQLEGMSTNLAFPLASGDQMLGLMNIQTTSIDILNIDQKALQTFADQISLSIQNIRLIDQLESRVQEINLLAGSSVRNAWEQVGGGGTIGYLYDRLHVMPAGESFPQEVTEQLLNGKSVSFVTGGEASRARLVAPIILRDNIIGVIGYDSDDVQHEWLNEEKALLETVASRVGLALENSRLVAEAQQRAQREQVISTVSNRVRQTLDLETVLKTAATELRQALNLQTAEVRLGIPTSDQKSRKSTRRA